MKIRMVIEIGSDGIVRVVESQPITEDGDPRPTPVTAQADPETAADSSYGETVKLDQNSPEFESRKAELMKLGYKWEHKEKAWRKPTNVNDSRKSARFLVRRVIQTFAIAMIAGMS